MAVLSTMKALTLAALLTSIMAFSIPIPLPGAVPGLPEPSIPLKARDFKYANKGVAQAWGALHDRELQPGAMRCNAMMPQSCCYFDGYSPCPEGARCCVVPGQEMAKPSAFPETKRVMPDPYMEAAGIDSAMYDPRYPCPEGALACLLQGSAEDPSIEEFGGLAEAMPDDDMKPSGVDSSSPAPEDHEVTKRDEVTKHTEPPYDNDGGDMGDLFDDDATAEHEEAAKKCDSVGGVMYQNVCYVAYEKPDSRLKDGA